MIKKLGLIFFIWFFTANGFSQYRKYTFQQPKMGSPFNIVIYSQDSLLACSAAQQAFLLIDTLNLIYSDYLPESELNRLCKTSGSGHWQFISEPLYTILQKAYRASVISKGRFDITASPVIRLWRTARKNQQLPLPDSLRMALKRVGYKNIQVNKKHRRARLLIPGMQLDLGGIAKGESAQRAIDRLRLLGFPYSLIDAGGDVVAGDAPPGKQGWQVAINLPETEELMEKQLSLHNKAVTTSGDLYQYLEVNGVRYSHIINPLTGQALTNSRNVTVIANNGADADWLTKACSIFPVETALKLVSGFEGAAVQIAVLNNGVPQYFRSPSFAAYFK